MEIESENKLLFMSAEFINEKKIKKNSKNDDKCPLLCLSVCYFCMEGAYLGENLKTINKNYVYHFWHLPSSGIIVKVVLHDLDLHFQGKKWNANISEAQNAKFYLIYFDICHRTGAFRKVYSVILTYIFKINYLKYDNL